MKRHLSLTAAFVALIGAASAQSTATTDPVGFVSVTVPAQSDAVLAVPLNRAAAFKGKIKNISGSIITVEGTPAWTANQFVQNIPTQNDTFAIQLATGTKEGLIAKVTANGVDTLTLQLDAGDDLSGVKTGDVDGILNADEIDVMPYWTPATLVTGTIPDGTEMYVFDNTTAGQSPSPTLLLQFFSGFGWYETVGFTDQSNRAMLFATGFVVRNNSGAAVPLSFVGSVPMSKHRLTLKTLTANVGQDQTIGYMSPVPEALATVGLGAADLDELYLFDNSIAGKNKAPTQLLVFFGGRWYDSILFSDVTDSITLQPGNGMIYRKASTASAQTFVWQNLQTYLAP